MKIKEGNYYLGSNKELILAVLAICVKNGIEPDENIEVENVLNQVTGTICINDGHISWCSPSRRNDDIEICSITEFVTVAIGLPISVGEYRVNKVDKTGFNVGCQRVSWEIYDKIGELRPK